MVQVNVFFTLIFTDLKQVNAICDVFFIFYIGYTLTIYIIYLKYITSLNHKYLGEGRDEFEGLITSRIDKNNIFCDLDQEYNLVENEY